MKNYNHILHKATTLLLTAAAAISLCLLTGCNREDLPETGKYNTMIVLRGDGTKALDREEAESIVIYAFSSGTDNLVGYLYEDNINGRDIFPMNLTAGGEIDFYVILNPKCNGFEIIDNDQPVEFDSHEGITPDSIQNWKLRRTGLEPGEAVPMSNLENQVDGYHNPTGESNRTFEVVANRNSWQEIPIQVTRAVSKVEVWFWANDNWTNQPYNYSSIDSQVLTDPVSESMVFDGKITDDSSTGKTEKSNNNSYHTNGTQGNLNNEKFKKYEEGTLFYNEDYFKLIWEQYILPNTLYGGDNMGQSTEPGENCTTLKIDYTYHYQEPRWSISGTRYEWQEEPQDKTIYLPASSRNTIINVWCALRDDTDRSFTYQVVDWDESVTVDIPDFD